ncbi:MAG: pyridoxamine 5'-phosphate oxidase family protein [bacterium]|nr:pyridoxamine 5'-phosphate oxidase family protein [bacterium]
MANKFHEIAFTDAVMAVQEKYGTRRHYAKLENRADSNARIGDAETDFIESRDSFYLATANDEGQPYIQFRGGPSGFLKVLDERTIGFADFRGNLQYISVGNASTNNKVAMILMDYPSRSRLKMLGEIEFFDASDRPDLIEKLGDPAYDAKVERAAVIHLKGIEWNCSQHITPRYTMDEVKAMIQPLYEHIESLESELAKCKGN